MEQKTLSAEPRRSFSNEFKLQMVKLASQPGASVARIAREHDINDNLLFKWLRLWQNEGRISRRLPVTTSSGAGVELLPVEITPDEQKEPMAALTPLLSTPSQVTPLKSCGLMLMVCACSPNAWRKASLSGLRCVTARYPLPARNWQCSSISWTGVSQKHPVLTH